MATISCLGGSLGLPFDYLDPSNCVSWLVPCMAPYLSLSTQRGGGQRMESWLWCFLVTWWLNHIINVCQLLLPNRPALFIPWIYSPPHMGQNWELMWEPYLQRIRRISTTLFCVVLQSKWLEYKSLFSDRGQVIRLLLQIFYIPKGHILACVTFHLYTHTGLPHSLDSLTARFPTVQKSINSEMAIADYIYRIYLARSDQSSIESGILFSRQLYKAHCAPSFLVNI